MLTDLDDTFFSEADDIVQDVETILLKLEVNKKCECDCTTQMKRDMHNLKGSAACVGQSKISELAHLFETIVIDTEIFDTETVDRLLAKLDRIRNLIELKKGA